ncbi:hypothetical protein [Spiroplasma melliferum]|uniref:Uncharacterized protein n=2 Tax=Spiroplasma melliferum TaxID=2134 RepID=A0AAI9X0D7_SPIME|nr:hypothetical protein [Spiroplasma melliferum]KAI92003.1 hypothetical protein SPM_006705 [Spiroplasma melliferum KC3]QCO23228.1 hypothetical protein SRED_003090 [Spiroplasma melliferum]QCO23242.1 hypothetical protein SRED_003104 [Spiroplasma melliferum]
MFDLNWSAVISLKYEDDEFYLLWQYYRNGKNKITEKQKDYIKNLFYQYYIPNTERQFEYLENKLNELNTRSASAIINGLLQKDKRLIALLVKYLEQFKPNNLT